MKKYKNKFASQSKNLASIIRGYKSSVTKQAHLLGYGFKWQSRFYDHIIRNEKSFLRIENYIASNPAKRIPQSDEKVLSDFNLSGGFTPERLKKVCQIFIQR